MTYESETRPLLVDVGLKFERAEMSDSSTQLCIVYRGFHCN